MTLFKSSPFQRHSATSREAAELMGGTRAGTLRAAVLEYIASRGLDGATDAESQMRLNMPGSTQRPRRVELVRLGLIRDSGKTRKTVSGRHAVVWVSHDV